MRVPLKNIIWTIIITFLLTAIIWAQEDMERIENDIFPNPKRPAAVFKHDFHNEAAQLDECNACHHIYENGEFLPDESSEDQSCSECHLLKSQGAQPSLRQAYHIKCKGCHLKKKAGPIICGECHQKF